MSPQTVSSSISTRRRSVLVALVVVLALLASACSSNSDPEDWATALAEGNVEQNFRKACEEADQGTTVDTVALGDYCTCSFTNLQETFADDFGKYKQVESVLRSDPEAIVDPQRESDPEIRTLLEAAAKALQSCQSEFLG